MSTPEMHPVIKEIRREVIDGERHFVVILSRANINHLLADCPEMDRLEGRAEDGAVFQIFNAPLGGLPKAFEFNGNVYHADLGLVGKPPPPNVPKEVYDRLSEIAVQRFIDTVQRSEDIPMEMRTSLGKVNVGFVTLRIEEEEPKAEGQPTQIP
jgi:hypothetical protein